ncbi:MAG TPA: hypothetical protein VI874_02870 [Candidatus Norongarragalinales archaeon]|nr:hypothetical protein [Candidatus Norongarragalinales archaeon]
MPRKSVLEWIQSRAWMDALKAKVGPKLKKVAFGPSPPNVFVGEYGYPDVRAGPLVALDEGILDAPQDLYGLNYAGLLHHRAHLARGYAVKNVKRVAEEAFWIAASDKAVDVEATFHQAPKFSLSFSSHHQPVGPTGELEKLTIADNPHVPKKIDTLLEEKRKVSEALPELMKGFDYHYIQKIMSAGILGKERKLVPTKWSITATDDLLGKEMLKKVRTLAPLDEIQIFTNNYLYNHFEILLLPGSWEFEQFESFETSPDISHEYEPFWGRTAYAKSEGGGYYAGRFGVIDALHKMGRQAAAVIFREVSPDYALPVGVWEVRHNVIGAFESKPFKTDDIAEAVAELKRRLKKPWKDYAGKSRILGQKKLTDEYE